MDNLKSSKKETWPPKNSNLSFIYFNTPPPSCLPYQPLSQITLSWAETLDQPTSALLYRSLSQP